MSKCPTCKRVKCKWVFLRDKPDRLSTDRLQEVVNHNISYIEMVFRNHQGSAASEERMYNSLTPYTDEMEKRKAKK